MEQKKIDRINELARLAKQRELTAEELAERDALRKEYIEDWRRSTIAVLENTYIQTPDGKKHKLPKKGQKNGQAGVLFLLPAVHFRKAGQAPVGNQKQKSCHSENCGPPLPGAEEGASVHGILHRFAVQNDRKNGEGFYRAAYSLP